MDDIGREVEEQVAAWRARIASLPGRHVALELLWDGDTTGWFLLAGIVTVQPDGTFAASHVAMLRYGGDLRLFNGDLPPWPEAVVAQRVGERIAEDLRIELYFPSPIHPDDSCPHWWERDGAIRCRTCDKLLTGDRGPYLPRDQCTPCHQAAERRKKLLADAPSRYRYLFCYVASGARIAVSLDHGDELLPLLKRVLGDRVIDERIETSLSAEQTAAMRDACATAIDALLLTYAPRADVPKWARQSSTLTWRGESREIEHQFNRVGESIHAFHHWHALFDTNETVNLLGNAGVSDRDVSFLCYIRAHEGLSKAALHAAFPFLPEEAVEETLTKLVHRGQLARDDDALRLTTTGRVLAH